MLPGGGECAARGMYLPEGCTCQRVYLPQCMLGYTLPLWTEFLTHASENITFPPLRLRTVKIKRTFLYVVLKPLHHLRYDQTKIRESSDGHITVLSQANGGSSQLTDKEYVFAF